MALTPEEGSAVRAKLNQVLELIDQMRAVDTTGVEPMSHAVEVPAGQRLRTDAVTETDRHAEFQAVAPAVERGLYLVPRVIE